MTHGEARGAASVTRIEARRGWATFGIGEIWDYRELLYFLIRRDLTIRYRQSLIGVGWAVIQPLLLLVVLVVVLGRSAGLAPPDVPYQVFAFAGLVPWIVFSQGVIAASASLVNSANLIQKVYFPRLLLPIAAVASFLVDFAVTFGLIVLMLLYYDIAVTSVLVLAVPFALLVGVNALGIGFILAALNVRYRDVRQATPFLVQLWLFASPVAYTLDLIPTELRFLYALNPLVGSIEGFRWAVLGIGSPPTSEIALSVLVTTVLLLVGIGYFRRVERTFADVI